VNNLTNNLEFLVLFMCRFATDSPAELELVRQLCLSAGAAAAVVANHWEEGGAGAADLGLAVIDACTAARKDKESSFRFLYSLDLPLKDKIECICREIYGADGVEFSDAANKRIEVRCIRDSKRFSIFIFIF
jgi:methylenetetrahydrofolate dehydrogenase (NADP+) / methenyltetrahydrofolate cyclohydrolase / formyltetrahydrofolate synthetase